jgi:signal transduction histidine kinase
VIQTRLTEDKQVQIRIRDNGIGISEEVRSKIFAHLFTTKKVGEGTELELAIVRQITVEKHQGSVTVNSVAGEGAEFIVTIPIKAD